MNVLRAYQSLNAEQKRILREKRVDLNRPIDELLALLRPLAKCDALADKARKSLGCTAGVLLLAIVIAAIVFSNIGWGPIALGVFVVIAAAFATFLYFWLWTRGIDVSNNFRSFALPVLTVLREDFASDEPVHVKLDLSSATRKEKQNGVPSQYSKGVYHKIVETRYLDPWMSAEAVLVDGTRLSWNVTDAIREQKKTKRNPRGKYKMKTKISKKTSLEVEVGLRRKLYEVNKAPANAEVTSDAKRTHVSVSKKVRSLGTDPIAPSELIDLVADIYRKATLVKTEAGA